MPLTRVPQFRASTRLYALNPSEFSPWLTTRQMAEGVAVAAGIDIKMD